MKILHINENHDMGKTNQLLREFKHDIESGKDIFMLIYMEGCGPCNAVRPEWNKLEHVLEKNNKKYSNIVIVDIDKNIFEKMRTRINSPVGYPTIKYISAGAKFQEDFEKSNTPNKNREIDNFVNWINLTRQNKDNNSNRNRSNHNHTHNKSIKSGGKSSKKRKWSMKYKHSINCKKPKGFSQKQYCKYGRKNKNKSMKRK